MLGKMTLLKISQDYHDFLLITLYGHCMVRDIRKPADSAGFVHYGGGHEMRIKAFPGLQNTLIQAHLSKTVPRLSRVFHFGWSFVWSAILKTYR